MVKYRNKEQQRLQCLKWRCNFMIDLDIRIVKEGKVPSENWITIFFGVISEIETLIIYLYKFINNMVWILKNPKESILCLYVPWSSLLSQITSIVSILQTNIVTVKPVLCCHSKRTPKLFFNTDIHLMQVKSIAECSKVSILQYFRPSLSYQFTLRPLFCLFLSGCLRQFLLYIIIWLW